jgi:hypothetical protein
MDEKRHFVAERKINLYEKLREMIKKGYEPLQHRLDENCVCTRGHFVEQTPALLRQNSLMPYCHRSSGAESIIYPDGRVLIMLAENDDDVRSVVRDLEKIFEIKLIEVPQAATAAV